MPAEIARLPLPLVSVPLPPRLAEVLIGFAQHTLTGRVEIHVHQGEIRSFTVEESHKVR